MSKNKNKFDNYAAKKFADINKIELMSEKEVYRILNSDVDTMIDQMVKNRVPDKKGKYPSYIANIFYNLSSAKYFYEWSKENYEDVSDDERDAILAILSQGYRDSISKKFSNQILDSEYRNEYLRKAFRFYNKARHKKVMKNLKLTKVQADELLIHSFVEPKFGVGQVSRLFDKSPVSNKKKLAMMKYLYKKNRFYELIGAAMTVLDSSDFVQYAFSLVEKSKKKERKKYLREYAECFKKTKRYTTLMKSKDFLNDNKKIIKSLIKEDVGFKKAFEILMIKGKEDRKKNNDTYKRVKKDVDILNSINVIAFD